MIPLKDDTARERLPLLNYLLIAINVAVFSRELLLGTEVEQFVSRFGLVPHAMTVDISGGFSPERHLLPWVTHMFIHGGWLHLLGNLWFLHIFGDNVEDRLGRFRFLVLFFSGGLVAGLVQIVTAPTDTTPMVGASGAISAVVGAYLVLYPRARILTLLPIFVLFYFIRIPAFIFIGLWFALQLLYGYTSLLAQTPGGVAWWAHVGGFAAGLVLAMLLKAGTVARPRLELAPGRINVLRGRRG
ncbi:MAG: rhomboid family intramembrane serine protease [Deltaproteobacteria bacterium]|nr:rhomboid family intramembrane serine protease [Deltaproteobacteria bacterium]